jgi:hypothetical protein
VRTLSSAFSRSLMFVLSLSSEAKAVMSPAQDKLVPLKVRLGEVVATFDAFL